MLYWKPGARFWVFQLKKLQLGIWTDPGAHVYPSNVLNVSIHVLEITGPLLNFLLCRFMSTEGHPGQGDEIMASPSGRVSGEQLLPLLCSTFATESTNLVSQAVFILTERSKLRIFYFWSTSSGWSVHSSKHQHTGSIPGLHQACRRYTQIKFSLSVHLSTSSG